MFVYIGSVSLLARGESNSDTLPLPRPAVILLFSPFAVIVVFHAKTLNVSGVVTLTTVVAWLGVLLYRAHRSAAGDLTRTIGPLLAGISLIDLTFVAAEAFLTPANGGAFIVFFFLALTAQRTIPAT